MKVLITRDSGDKRAPETLIDPLATTQAVGIELGKAYLYDTGFDKLVYETKVPYRSEKYPSELLAIHDSSMGESFVSRLTGISINISSDENSVSVDHDITSERSTTPL